MYFMKLRFLEIVVGIFFLLPLSAQNLEIQGKVEGPPEIEWEHGFVFLTGTFPVSSSSGVPKPAVLDQKDFQFYPRVVALAPGQELKVKNSDNELHNVHGYGEDGLTRFNVPVVAGMKTTLRTDRVEVIDIFCDIHAQMRAYILCLENPYFTRLNSDGTFFLKSLPDQAQTISFWHPYLEPRTQKIEGTLPILFKTGWRTGFQPKSATERLLFTVYSFREISEEIENRLKEVLTLPKEQAFGVIDDCYFTLYEAGGMETAVRFHLSGRRAFVHEQGFRDIKEALREASLENGAKRIDALILDLKMSAEELKTLGIENKPEFSTGSIQFSQKPKRNEYLTQTTTRKLVTLFQETKDLSIAEMILETCFERGTPYLERFLLKFSEYETPKQILLLKHLKHFSDQAQTRSFLIACTKSESWLLRSTALDGLRYYSEVESIFQNFLTDPSPLVQQKALQGLIYQSGSCSLATAEPYLIQENPDLRLSAIYGLIEVAQQQKEGSLVEEIQKRLWAIGEDAENRPDIRQEVWKFLGPKTQSQWIKAMSEENPQVREGVLYTAVQHNYEVALFLRDGLCDPESRVRLTALLLLSRIPENAPLVERLRRWISVAQKDGDLNIQNIAKTWTLEAKKNEALSDLQLFCNAYELGHLRTAYFFLSEQEKKNTSFTQFSRSYWKNPQLKQWFAGATFTVMESDLDRVSVQVKLGGLDGVAPVFFILTKEELFWKITKK